MALGTDKQTDLHALNNFLFLIDKVSFKSDTMSLSLVVLEKLFTWIPTQMPKSDAIMSGE